MNIGISVHPSEMHVILFLFRSYNNCLMILQKLSERNPEYKSKDDNIMSLIYKTLKSKLTT